MIRPLCELDPVALEDLMPEIPLWVKSPDYERVSIMIAFLLFSANLFINYVYIMMWRIFLQVDWLNKFLSDMWPFLDKVLFS